MKMKNKTTINSVHGNVHTGSGNITIITESINRKIDDLREHIDDIKNVDTVAKNDLNKQVDLLVNELSIDNPKKKVLVTQFQAVKTMLNKISETANTSEKTMSSITKAGSALQKLVEIVGTSW
jgi:hypothetical protein